MSSDEEKITKTNPPNYRGPEQNKCITIFYSLILFSMCFELPEKLLQSIQNVKQQDSVRAEYIETNFSAPLE